VIVGVVGITFFPSPKTNKQNSLSLYLSLDIENYLGLGLGVKE
jgi:hypothetical protein